MDTQNENPSHQSSINAIINSAYNDMTVRYSGAITELSSISSLVQEYGSTITELISTRQEYAKMLEKYSQSRNVKVAIPIPGLITPINDDAAITIDEMQADSKQAFVLTQKCMDLEGKKEVAFQRVMMACRTALSLFINASSGANMIINHLSMLCTTAANRPHRSARQTLSVVSDMADVNQTASEVTSDLNTNLLEATRSLFEASSPNPVKNASLQSILALPDSEKRKIYTSLIKKIEEAGGKAGATHKLVETNFDTTDQLILTSSALYKILNTQSEVTETSLDNLINFGDATVRAVDHNQSIIAHTEKIADLQESRVSSHDKSLENIKEIIKLIEGIELRGNTILHIVAARIDQASNGGMYTYGYEPEVFTKVLEFK